ncbi:GNAT family N-acetyltransferase [Marinobacter lipolyticus]|uniref:GNAT family N-acetyltransferase n=1 Tax=Marinobacter lipolyticus TaxID=209639 RepID=UPI001BCD786D|nr:GNAT family N-acetyltransferase [Marinobacter lipolyticus]MBS8238950.1 GNAT family N-acetyltransferase [Marinobacter lipolyticus]
MSLFQSHAWQSAWWETWGGEPGFRLVRRWHGGTSGLYESRYRLKGILPVRSLQFVGTSYRKLRTPRTEYNRFCPQGQTGKELIAAMVRVLERQPWTEVVFNDLLSGSEELSALVTIAATHKWAFRIHAADEGYAVATDGYFRDYLAALGPNSRLRLYNRRKLLEAQGEVRLDNAWPARPQEFFEALNRFHRSRWHKDCVTERSLGFHLKFLARIVEEGGRPQLSLLTCDGDIVSVLYNVWYDGVVYNIQAGFQEAFHKKLSLGSLHLGYAIEDAFEHPETRRFDFLAGEGKNEDYKSRFANENYQFISVMLVKSLMFRALYWMRG